MGQNGTVKIESPPIFKQLSVKLIGSTLRADPLDGHCFFQSTVGVFPLGDQGSAGVFVALFSNGFGPNNPARCLLPSQVDFPGKISVLTSSREKKNCIVFGFLENAFQSVSELANVSRFIFSTMSAKVGFADVYKLTSNHRRLFCGDQFPVAEKM
ncbi:MAG: hypothetical protein IPI11_17760 [Haliscomenobacter sp.]|nr:hypothetical protein [Haliscomenobacter sp.]